MISPFFPPEYMISQVKTHSSMHFFPWPRNVDKLLSERHIKVATARVLKRGMLNYDMSTLTNDVAINIPQLFL